MLNIIQGGVAKDHRGQIRFVNDFDMSLVKRFYIIKNLDTELVRGWRAHKIEQRWFYVLSGSFSVDLVKIDNWEVASPDLPVDNMIMPASNLRVLHVPAGYGTAFKAMEPDSELLVYSDFEIEHAANDDHTYPLDYFKNRKQ
ncbi:hypothetical protein [Sphingobacterium multivorum]|uniref:hypothetical protein n=1 Tax=Sphingobacterium multivorum TaxID=28454 RepID=UPI0028984103|nr:hypothetical protein [Sphingobacterium multivorum]